MIENKISKIPPQALSEPSGLTDTVAGRTKILREYYNETQIEFAKRLGVSQSYLAALEKGRRKPNKKVIEGINNMGFTLEWYLFGEKNAPGTGSKEILKTKTAVDNLLLKLDADEMTFIKKVIEELVKMKTAKK